jgi:hypothetical protein
MAGKNQWVVDKTQRNHQYCPSCCFHRLTESARADLRCRIKGVLDHVVSMTTRTLNLVMSAYAGCSTASPDFQARNTTKSTQSHRTLNLGQNGTSVCASPNFQTSKYSQRLLLCTALGVMCRNAAMITNIRRTVYTTTPKNA